jgi:hypothetical protein
MKHFFATMLLLLFASSLSFGQIAVRVFNYRPTGEFGFAMNPLNSFEIALMGKFTKGATQRTDRRMRVVFSFVHLKMKPRLDVFPIYGVMTGGNSTTSVTGEQSFQRYNITQITLGADFAIIHKKKFNFYAGGDLIVGGTSVAFTKKIPGVIDEDYEGGGGLGGLRLRLGAEYSITDHFGVFVNTHRSGFFLSEPAGFLWAYDYGFGMRYSFN